MKNTPLMVFWIAILVIAIIILGSMPSVQNSLVYYLKLDGTSSARPLVSGSKDGIEEAKVNRVIDGDTVLLQDGRTVRFLNIDTPETKKPNTEVMCFGPEASSYNNTLMQDRQILMTRDKDDEDKYGRILRFVFLIGQDTTDITNSVNYQLVQRGYARSYIIKPNDTYKQEFVEAESKAKKQNIGVWKCPKPFEE